jgi:hypothetical protein
MKRLQLVCPKEKKKQYLTDPLLCYAVVGVPLKVFFNYKQSHQQPDLATVQLTWISRLPAFGYW